MADASVEPDEQHLFLLGNSEWVINSLSFKTREGDRKVQRQEFLERARQAVPDDPVPVIGLARLADVKNQSARAIELLEGVLAADPDQYEAWAMLGQLLARTGDARRFLDWNSRVPESAEQDARTWFARATWAKHRNEERVGARCLWECLNRDPNHLAANLQLAQSLDRLGRSDDAIHFRRRAAQLSELVTLLRGLAGDPRFGEERTEQRVQRLGQVTRVGDAGCRHALQPVTLLGWRQLQQPRQQEQQEPQRQQRDTVSYPHLTLPTILLV